MELLIINKAAGSWQLMFCFTESHGDSSAAEKWSGWGEVLFEAVMMELTVFTKTLGFAPQSWWRSGTFHPLKAWGGFRQETWVLNEEARHFLVGSLTKIMRSIIHLLSEISGSEFVNSLHPVICR